MCVYVLCVLQKPVLKHKDGQLKVSLHSSITSMLEEAKWMERLGLEVPDAIHQLSLTNIKNNFDQLKVLNQIVS